MADVPLEDERELLTKGTGGVSEGLTKQPLLGAYLPVNPVQRYTFKKWSTDDWSRYNDTKRFQSSRDREASRKYVLKKFLISLSFATSYSPLSSSSGLFLSFELNSEFDSFQYS